MGRLTSRKENGEAYVQLYADPAYPARVVREQLEKEKKVIEKLAHYEDIEEQLENLYGGKMPLDKVVENLNRIVQNGEEKLDYARILTNTEDEKWDKWLDLEEQGRLVFFPMYAYFIKEGKIHKGWVQETVHTVSRKPLYDVRYDDSSLANYRGYLGNTVFLTKEEAEAALKEGEQE